MSPMLDITEPESPKLWTVEEFGRLYEIGLLAERCELIEGVIRVMGYNPPHAATVMSFMRWLIREFGADFVACQVPISLPLDTRVGSRPQPDAMALNVPMDHFALEFITVDALEILIEVADTTLQDDTGVKALLYSRAGVRDYWVADINTRQVRIHRDPTSEGYGIVTIYAEHQEVSPLAHPDSKVHVGSLFPTLKTEEKKKKEEETGNREQDNAI